MEGKIKNLRNAVVSVMEEYAERRKNSVKDLRYELITDDTNYRYQLVLFGWYENERIYHLLIHIDIINDKIWIQEDNTEYSAANMLTDKGLSKKDIVLAYFSEFHRSHGEFAVA